MSLRSEMRPPAQKYLELRESIMTLHPASQGISLANSRDDVWCVLMETGIEDARFTLLFKKDGNSSVHFDNGGGVIGEFSDPGLVAAVKHATSEAFQYLKFMVPAKDFPLVDRNQVQFLFLTGAGPFTVDIAESVLANQEHEFAKFYGLCHDVLAALREKTESK